MAQTVNEIQDELMANASEADNLPAIEVLTENEQANLGYITSTSKVGVFRKLIFVFAKASFSLQQLWETFKAEILAIIASSRPFTEGWYQKTSLAYQHGYDLNIQNEYESPSTPQELEAANNSKLVKKAAVTKTILSNVGALRIKIAGIVNGELVPVNQDVINGFQEYIERKGAAGDFILATSGEGDDLKLVWKIYFNPLVLDNQGKRLDGSNDTPVQSAVKAYLKTNNSKDFNGKLSLAKLTDQVQNVEGVEDPHLTLAASKYGAYNYNEANNIGSVGLIENYRQPDSGYFKLDDMASVFEFIPV